MKASWRVCAENARLTQNNLLVIVTRKATYFWDVTKLRHTQTPTQGLFDFWVPQFGADPRALFAAVFAPVGGDAQVTLKNYDPQRDKRFSGTFKLPTIPR